MPRKEDQNKPKRRGRPKTLVMPDTITDTPENIARAVLSSPTTPPGGWKYLKDHKASVRHRTSTRPASKKS